MFLLQHFTHFAAREVKGKVLVPKKIRHYAMKAYGGVDV
jgi:hypothetical protein